MRYPLPTRERSLIRLFDQSQHWAMSADFPVALRYYGILNLGRVCAVEPGLRFEIIPILRELLNDPSPGVRGQARKILEMWGKVKRGEVTKGYER